MNPGLVSEGTFLSSSAAAWTWYGATAATLEREVAAVAGLRSAMVLPLLSPSCCTLDARELERFVVPGAESLPAVDVPVATPAPTGDAAVFPSTQSPEVAWAAAWGSSGEMRPGLNA
jgi:hypothetical protein